MCIKYYFSKLFVFYLKTIWHFLPQTSCEMNCFYSDDDKVSELQEQVWAVNIPAIKQTDINQEPLRIKTVQQSETQMCLYIYKKNFSKWLPRSLPRPQTQLLTELFNKFDFFFTFYSSWVSEVSCHTGKYSLSRWWCRKVRGLWLKPSNPIYSLTLRGSTA